MIKTKAELLTWSFELQKEIRLLHDKNKQAIDNREQYKQAMCSLMPWVGKGIADQAYSGCVASQAAVKALDYATRMLEVDAGKRQ